MPVSRSFTVFALYSPCFLCFWLSRWGAVQWSRGRARRGARAALYPKRSWCGAEFLLAVVRLPILELERLWGFRPHAADVCEPRQVRKEAAVSGPLRVPWEHWAWAGRVTES